MASAWPGFSLEFLTTTVSRAKVDASVPKVVALHLRADLIVIDDIGTVPTGQEAAEVFYRMIDGAYEKRSVAVTSNLHPAGLDTMMPKALATPTVDRLSSRPPQARGFTPFPAAASAKRCEEPR